MFKTILSLAVIALVSTTDASKISHKTLKVNSTLAQLKAKSQLMQDSTPPKEAKEEEESDSASDEEDECKNRRERRHGRHMRRAKNHVQEKLHDINGDDDAELPTSISLEEAEFLIGKVDLDNSGDVNKDEIKEACDEYDMSRRECRFILKSVKHCDSNKDKAVTAPELQACINDLLSYESK